MIRLYASIIAAAVVLGLWTAELKAESETWEVTAYCLRGTRTASGTWPQPGTVAAPLSIPFGSTLWIEGYPWLGVVEDRGGVITGDRLDVYYDSCRDAIEWGRRWVMITWVTEEEDAP